MDRPEQKGFIKEFDRQYYRSGRGLLCLGIIGACIGGAIAVGNFYQLNQGFLMSAMIGAAGGIVGGLLQYPIYLSAMAKKLKSRQSKEQKDAVDQ